MGAIAGTGGHEGSAELLRQRISQAMLVCIARWGITKTTLEDVAREAGCGRATIYRTFEGGKTAVLAAVVAGESARLRLEVDQAIAAVAEPDDLEAVAVAGVVAGARFLQGHEALAYMLAHEPDVVLPWVGFHHIGALFGIVGEFAVPHLARFVPDPEEARRAAEWLARVVLAYVLNPADGIDLTEPAGARHLLATYVLPGLRRSTSAPQEEPTCP